MFKFYKKLETSSERVNGLSFHCKRPWILASLDSGSIQLWDYRCKTLIQKFHGHHGPVRAVHFHDTHPLFVSGGDDYTIKVWDYQLQRCLFTLLGHFGCIRTVEFHLECPWILSASEDYTIRIWDWQSRSCISVMKYHRDFVMCASFHPQEDLVLSAGLDRTALIWDVSALRKKKISLSSARGAFVRNAMTYLKAGFYWASFQSTCRFVAVNESTVMLFRMGGDVAWKEQCACANAKISCVLFPKQDGIMISCTGENKIQVWICDCSMIRCIYSYVSEHDRLWSLASHPRMNLLAACHDSGMVLFKLERERPAFSVSGAVLFYVKGGSFLHIYEYSTQKDTELIKIRESLLHSKTLNQGPRSLSYSPSDNTVLICSDEYGGCYELYTGDPAMDDTVKRSKGGSGRSAVFVGKNRFAVLMKDTNEVLVKNLEDETILKSLLPSATDEIFYAGSGNLLCRGHDTVYIFDFQQRIVFGTLQTSSFVRNVVWSCDMERVALLCKQSMLIADKNLTHRCTIHETVRIKSGAWDDSGEVFIYTTHTHIKFCLPDGDSGIIKSLGVTMYVTKKYGNTIFCLDRDGKNHPIVIDSTEYVFKLSLLRKRHDQVMSMIRNNPEKLCDNKAITAYLHQKYPEVALCLLKDEHARFNLALEIGNIKMALESVKKIDDKHHWYRLGVEALRHGNLGVAEYAYQKTQNFRRLSFLYLITGNLDKLLKMIKIFKLKNEIMSQFQNALYLGDVGERVKVLESADHLPLAYITADVHGLNDLAERLAKELGGNVPSMPKGKKASLLLPPTHILAGGDWPLQTKGISEDGLSTSVLKGSSSRVRTGIELIESQNLFTCIEGKKKKNEQIHSSGSS